MQRIGEAGGLFIAGDPQTNTKGTIVTAAWLNALQEELANIVEGAGKILDPNDNSQVSMSIVKRLPAVASLPTEDVGPIWHDGYNSMMTWQVFNQNGANYAGYASVLVGSLLLDTQPTPRVGYVRSGVSNLSRTSYAALRAWAQHHGRMVDVGVWVAGQIVCADNVDGTTYRIYDVRGEFIRCWDDGRGVDSGRLFGSGQGPELASHNHIVYGNTTPFASGGSSLTALSLGTNDANRTSQSTGGTETRPRNAALLAAVKY